MKVRHWVICFNMVSMINSESSELKQIVWGSIPPNVHLSKEQPVQMFSGVCPCHITKVMLRLSYRKRTAKDRSTASDMKKI